MITQRNSAEFRVYCLKRDLSREIFYIGLTKNSLKFRKQQHEFQSKSDFESEKGIYINKLWRYREDFYIEELCWFSSTYEDAKHVETAYILTAINEGIRLKNISKKNYNLEKRQFHPIIETNVHEYFSYPRSKKLIKIREIL